MPCAKLRLRTRRPAERAGRYRLDLTIDHDGGVGGGATKEISCLHVPRVAKGSSIDQKWLAKGLGGKGKIDVQRFKGLGEMDAKDLKDTTMNPLTRKLIRVSIDEDSPGETGDLVERLMGKKPELRFQYIQENARFVEELDV